MLNYFCGAGWSYDVLISAFWKQMCDSVRYGCLAAETWDWVKEHKLDLNLSKVDVLEGTEVILGNYDFTVMTLLNSLGSFLKGKYIFWQNCSGLLSLQGERYYEFLSSFNPDIHCYSLKHSELLTGLANHHTGT